MAATTLHIAGMRSALTAGTTLTMPAWPKYKMKKYDIRNLTCCFTRKYLVMSSELDKDRERVLWGSYCWPGRVLEDPLSERLECWHRAKLQVYALAKTLQKSLCELANRQ